MIYTVFELTVCRETASRHHRTSHSQKRTPARNTISQAIHIQEQSRSGYTNTAPLTTHKQHPCRQKSMFLYPFSCYVTPLTRSRPYKVHRSSITPQGPIENGNGSTKRTRISPSSCTAEEKLNPEAASDTSESRTDPLQPWIQNGRWPKEYFEQESQVREDFKRGKSPEVFEQRDWLQERCLKELFRPMHGFYYLPYLFARERSSSSLRCKNSESSFQTPSDQLPRKVQSAQCRTIEYEIGLENKVGSRGLRFDQ